MTTCCVGGRGRGWAGGGSRGAVAAMFMFSCLLFTAGLVPGWSRGRRGAAEDGARSAGVRMLVPRPHHPRLLEARGCPARYTTSGGRGEASSEAGS